MSWGPRRWNTTPMPPWPSTSRTRYWPSRPSSPAAAAGRGSHGEGQGPASPDGGSGDESLESVGRQGARPRRAGERQIQPEQTEHLDDRIVQPPARALPRANGSPTGRRRARALGAESSARAGGEVALDRGHCARPEVNAEEELLQRVGTNETGGGHGIVAHGGTRSRGTGADFGGPGRGPDARPVSRVPVCGGAF